MLDRTDTEIVISFGDILYQIMSLINCCLSHTFEKNHIHLKYFYSPVEMQFDIIYSI